MGSGVFEMGAVLGAKGSTKAKELKRGGTLFIKAQKAEGTGSFRLKLSGNSLTNTEGFMKKSDPFYQFTRKDIGARSVMNDVHMLHFYFSFNEFHDSVVLTNKIFSMFCFI